MIKNQKLSNNFWLSEFTKSSTAERLDIDNWPTDQEVVDNLRKVAVNIAQPIRDYFKVPLTPNSGYRCLELNRALKSKDTSQHVKGEAIDIEVPGTSNYDLALWIMNNLDYDQLILEMYNPEQGVNSGWVHCSYKSPEENRRQVLTIFSSKAGGGVVVGLQTTKK